MEEQLELELDQIQDQELDQLQEQEQDQEMEQQDQDQEPDDGDKEINKLSVSSKNEPGAENAVTARDDGYDISNLRGPQSIADLGRDSLALHHVFGTDMTRRGGIFLIEDDTILYAVSAAVVFESTISGKKEYLLGLDDNGIGCVTVHPSRYVQNCITFST